MADTFNKIKKANLLGRGGASFPAWKKWETAKQTKSDTKYVICNSSEGELDAFKDLYIWENYPEHVFKGMVYTMDYLKTKQAYININTNYYTKLQKIIDSLIKKYNSKGYNFKIFKEKPSYIGGEASTILNSIEGKPAQPRARHFRTTVKGLFEKPTLIQNVETFYDVAITVDKKYDNKRFIGIFGDGIRKKFVIRCNNDLTIQKILDLGKIKIKSDYFVQVGGSASGPVFNSEQIKTEQMTGIGSIEIYNPKKRNSLKILQRWLKFYANESCGKCIPCREGSYQAYELVKKLRTEKNIPWEAITKITELMEKASFCGLGKALNTPVQTYIKNILHKPKQNSEEVEIFINCEKIIAQKGENILAVALRNGFDIPYLCYHEDLPIDGNCRACLVEVADDKKGNYITTSCTLKAAQGLKVLLDTPEVVETRKANLELLFADHKEKCVKCKNGYPCYSAKLMKKYDIQPTYKRYDKQPKVHKMGTAAEFDPDMCINCNRCVQVCKNIGISFLKFEGKGYKKTLTYNKNPKIDCIYCGQCTVACPMSAIREQRHTEKVIKILKDPKKFVIVQTAPSVRVSIGESFKMGYGINCEGKLNTVYRKLGFDKVFDVNFGADITTIVEAKELVERLEKPEFGIGKKLPMFTSCCPGWVKMAEFYNPELIPNLTTSRSPQIHSGGIYKTWYAEKMGLNPKDIVVVSIMPCTSKKYECQNKEMFINGNPTVDYVLTTRELAGMIKKAKIDFPNLKESKVDKYGEYSGAAAIYGSSGGVMESALRTAYNMITKKELKNLSLKQVRTSVKGFKTAEIDINGEKIKIAVAATPKHVREIIQEIKLDPKAYHYVEVMACAGGCVGGGGQPFDSTKAIIEKRRKALYKIDDKKKLRLAHKNKLAKDFFEWLKNKKDKKLEQDLLYRTYSKKKKFE